MTEANSTEDLEDNRFNSFGGEAFQGSWSSWDFVFFIVFFNVLFEVVLMMLKAYLSNFSFYLCSENFA